MFGYRKLKPHLLNADPCSEAHIHVIPSIKKKSFLLKFWLFLFIKNAVLLSMCGQQTPQASFEKAWKIICCCLFCSQKHSVLDSLPRNTRQWCAIAHTKQWTIFVKLATLQWMNFMPRGDRDSVPAPNMISQAWEVGMWLWWHRVWCQVRSSMPKSHPTSIVSSLLEWEAEDAPEQLFHGHLNPCWFSGYWVLVGLT